MLKFKKLHPDVKLPTWGTKGSVGCDVYAFCLSESGRPNTRLIPPRNTVVIETGLLIEPPYGFAVMVCSRSGLAKSSIFIANAPGIIDPDYRGEIKVLLYNGGLQSHYVRHDDRIAQLVLIPAFFPSMVEMEELSQTERGEKGFGSTGA